MNQESLNMNKKEALEKLKLLDLVNKLTRYDHDTEEGYPFGDMDPPVYSIMVEEEDGGYLQLDDVINLIKNM